MPSHDPATLPVSPSLLRAVSELGYSTLTPVQAESIPALLSGRDLLGQSPTGSGKTLAFALPLLNRLELGRRRVQALVLTPTRELAEQVTRELRKLGRHEPDLRVLTLVGGRPVGRQARSLEVGVHVVVGTPGRVLDHLTRGGLDLGGAGCVVLDEADRMLEMGFQEDVEQILAATPSDRQTVLFSATLPPDVEDLGRRLQRDPVRVRVETETIPEIRHELYVVAPTDRFRQLLALLSAHRPDAALVFCNLKVRVDEVAERLASAGFAAAPLHGDLDQADRDSVMARFRNESVRVLVASDVAARGLDVEHLDVVYNYDLPARADVYVHRVGRTGRAGRTGLAVSLATADEPVADIEQIVPLARCEPFDRPTIALEAPNVTLRIGGGRKDKLRPGDILGALTGDAGLPGDRIGRIEIHDRQAFVAVARDVARPALKRLRAGRIKGRRFRVDPA